ncbi:F-box protein CPR1-like [Solanum dulcamara]|uniref:F-box protein CPR1-like n=1 Tax=Solanum dulcamara TaxID=45834 RepID=UPI0024855BA0|nr:F-box protein CPR1-like [Solanum dulcamara]
MSDYLPKELLVDIFTRLPVISILRCTSVCKSWYSLIANPNFISIHLNRKQDDHILIRNYFENTKVDMYAMFGNNERLDHNYVDFVFSNDSISIVGSLNGILCLADADNLNDFYFCNLSIRKTVKLAEPAYLCDKCNTSGSTLGFGFDSVCNDYKVVRIVHTMIHSFPPRVDLYKSSTGVWEDITHVSGSFVFIFTTPQVFVNGASYWIASKLEVLTFRRVIVVFNMHDETFSDMILPSSLTNASRARYDEMFLFVSQESLCLVDNNYDKREPIEIWMMRGYGEPDSWVKQFSIQNYYLAQNIPLRYDIFWTPYCGSAAPTELEIANDFVKPMAITKNGEILWKGNQRLLVSVDDTVEKFKDVDIGNCKNDWCYNPRYVTYYKESLVLPDRWTNSYVGDACEESSDLWKREPKDGKRKISREKSKYKMRIASLLHISGLLYVSKMKWKWLQKKGRKSMQVKKPSLSN